MPDLDAAALRDLVPRPRVIYTDVDGTFVGPGGGFFTASGGAFTIETASALQECARRGVDVMLVSGRGRRGLTEVCRLLGLRNFVAELGSVVVYDLGAAEIVLAHPPEGFEPESPFELMQGPVSYLLETYPGRLEMHAPWYQEREFSSLLRGEVDEAAANADLAGAGHGWLRLIDNGVLPRRSPTLPGVDRLHVYHLVARGVSKSNAVAADMRRRGLVREETMAAGDALSDLELSGPCGAVIVPRNAVEKDPAVASAVETLPNAFVAKSGHGAGWAEAVRAVLS